jgi:hypothetical protein
MIIEVVDHRNRVRQRARVPEHRFTIGRGYDNDLIVDDPYVDAHHLEVGIEPDGVARFHDPGSANGTWLRTGERQTGGVVSPGLELRIGRTLLRFVDPRQPVAPALPDRGGASAAQFLLRRRTLAWAVVAGAVLVPGVGAWLDSSDPVSLSDLASPAFAALLAGALWAGGWAVASRLVVHRIRFSAHLGWAAAIGVGSVLLDVGGEWLGFLWPAAEWMEWLGTLGQVALVVLLLAGHLALVTEWPAGRRLRIAAGVAAIGYLTSLALTGTGGAPVDDTAAHARTLKPLAAGLVPATDLDRFFGRVESLQRAVDELVEGDGR